MFALLAVTTAVTSTEPALTAIVSVTSEAGTPSIVANPVRKASRSEAPKLTMVAPARGNEESMENTVTGVTTMVMTGVILMVFVFESIVRVFGFRGALFNGSRILDFADVIVVVISVAGVANMLLMCC